MNTAQHACNILQAWNRSDRPGLEIALNSAWISCSAPESISRLEFEKQEVLESVVEHLRSNNSLQCSRDNGALTLLSHLSSDLSSFEPSGSQKLKSSANSLKFGMKRAKCFTAAAVSRETKQPRQ